MYINNIWIINIVNSFRYDDILNSSRLLTIPCIRCDDQLLNRIIKHEIIDETDCNNDNQLFHLGLYCNYIIV